MWVCLMSVVNLLVCLPRRLCYMLCICHAEAECNNVHTISIYHDRAMMNIKMMLMMVNISKGLSNTYFVQTGNKLNNCV